MNPRDGFHLLFDWPSRHAVHLALPLMLLVSALAHLGGIAAIQLAPPRLPNTIPRSASAYCLPQTLNSGQAILPLIASQDPSLFSPSASEERAHWHIPASEYIPSFDENRPTFAPPPETSPPPSTPGLLPSGPIPMETPRAPRPSRRPLPTQLRFTAPLAARLSRSPELPAFSTSAIESPAPAEFLITVAPDGQVLHVFPIHSSGSDLLDSAAITTLLHARFDPSPQSSPEDGFATFLWGADVEHSPQK